MAGHWLRAAILLAALGARSAIGAQDDVALRFANADIESLVKLVSEITGRSFVLDPRVKGTVSIVASRPVPRSQVYPLFLSALRLQGFAVIEDGAVAKIVPEADAKVNAGPTIERDARAAGDRVVTLVYPLQNESAAQLLPVLRPLIPANNTIAVLPGSNTLVITDYASNINRLTKILEAVDRADAAEITVIALQHASALDMAPMLARLVPDGAPATPVAGAPPPRPLITPDPRSNSLLVRSAHPTVTARVVDLAAKLDVPARSPGNVHVIYLRNAEAAKVAETLRGLAAAEAKTAAAPGQPAPAAPPTSFIQADAATNSLLIAAPDHVYNTLRGVVERLDTRRAQVYLEALIAEVSTDLAAELGIQFQALSGAAAGSRDTRVIGGTNFDTAPGSSILGAARNIATLAPGINVGVVRGRITLPGVGEVLNLGLLARALESEAQANVLSTPNLLTMDNEEAKIVVGQNVPFITGAYAQAASGAVAGAVNPFQTIDRRDVGLTLRVRPQIAEGRTVKLRIYQEVSSIQDVTNAAGIITNKRSIESAVLVEDGEIVVLGGLIQDDVKAAVDKVPLLGDLPIIGQLFRYDTRRRVKTNLMVFLRPVVLREPSAAASLTVDRYDYIRNEQASVVVPPRALLPGLPTPELPPLPEP